MVKLELTKPLVPKKTVDCVTLEVAELVPPREIYPRNAGGGDKAISDFKTQVSAVASQLLGEYREKEATTEPHASNRDASIRQRLLYDLNTSGKYYAYKESLKRAVIMIPTRHLHTHLIRARNVLRVIIAAIVFRESRADASYGRPAPLT